MPTTIKDLEERLKATDQRLRSFEKWGWLGVGLLTATLGFSGFDHFVLIPRKISEELGGDVRQQIKDNMAELTKAVGAAKGDSAAITTLAAEAQKRVDALSNPDGIAVAWCSYGGLDGSSGEGSYNVLDISKKLERNDGYFQYTLKLAQALPKECVLITVSTRSVTEGWVNAEIADKDRSVVEIHGNRFAGFYFVAFAQFPR